MGPKSAPDQEFSIPLSSSQNVTVKIHISELRAQGLHLAPWASSNVLAKLLHKLEIAVPADDRIQDESTLGTESNSSSYSLIPILELGAGIGLVGIVASALWGRKAIVTDLEPIVPGLTHNIQLNSNLLQQHNDPCEAGTLDWGQPDQLVLSDGKILSADATRASIIIAADTIYDDNHPGMLAQTILKWLAPSSESRCILTYPLRVAYLDQIRELWQLLEAGGLVAVREGKEMAEGNEYDWDDERLCEWSVWHWKDC